MSATQRTLTLESNDGRRIVVGTYCILASLQITSAALCVSTSSSIALTSFPDREVAERSVLIKHMMEDIGDQAADQPIPIPNVSS